MRAAGVVGSALVRVPADYYDRPLAARAALLQSHPATLCKTIVLKNGAATATLDPGAPLGAALYVAIVMQYVARLDMTRLERVLRARGAPADSKWTLASDATAHTGFDFNAITIFGWAHPIPVIVAKPIVELPRGAAIWLGALVCLVAVCTTLWLPRHHTAHIPLPLHAQAAARWMPSCACLCHSWWRPAW